jgi:hypothetical protein
MVAFGCTEAWFYPLVALWLRFNVSSPILFLEPGDIIVWLAVHQFYFGRSILDDDVTVQLAHVLADASPLSLER